ncbi:OsmC family protein [Providencia sp. PROV236]|uniref:OsmC family protein n=1 Tax=Providencia sp. PROV236 TaxID=2936798 RepID=UPI0034E197E6
MAKRDFNVNITSTDDFKIICKARNFSYYLDAPSIMGGTDSGMTPVESLLAAIGACQCLVTKFFAVQKGIVLKDVKVDMIGEFDGDRLLGINEKAELGFSKIISKFHIKAENSESEIKEFIDFVVHNSPVNDSIKPSISLLTEVYVL